MAVAAVAGLKPVVVNQASVNFAVDGLFPESDALSCVVDHEIDEARTGGPAIDGVHGGRGRITRRTRRRSRAIRDAAGEFQAPEPDVSATVGVGVLIAAADLKPAVDDRTLAGILADHDWGGGGSDQAALKNGGAGTIDAAAQPDHRAGSHPGRLTEGGVDVPGVRQRAVAIGGTAGSGIELAAGGAAHGVKTQCSRAALLGCALQADWRGRQGQGRESQQSR